jgi:hypothetical protein
MIKNKNPRPTNYQEGTGREVSITDGIVCAPNQITISEQVKFDSWFERVDDKDLVNIKRLAEAFNKLEDDCIKIVTRSPKLFKGEHFEFTGKMSVKSDNAQNPKPTRGRPQKDHYLTRDGCLVFLNRLDYNRYDPDISEFIIRFQKWLIKTASDVLDGNLIHSHVKPLIWSQEREESKSNHKICMIYVKTYEVPKGHWTNSREPYQRESREINVDVVGVHIKGLSDKLSASGLRIKNDAYITDMALMEAGIEFENRHQIVKNVLDTTYQTRHIEDLLLTTTEQARIRKQIPECQTGIYDFMAVV